MSKNVSECKSNAALVQWSPSGLSVDAPDMAEIDKAFAAKCDLDDAGNPEATSLLKINDVASTDAEIIAALEQVPELNISCHAGDLVARKAVRLHLGPESVKASPEQIEAKEGEAMVFACELPEKIYPGAEITYKIDGKVVASNLTAKAEHNGKKIFCTAKNTLSMKEATANISMNVQFKPSTSRALIRLLKNSILGSFSIVMFQPIRNQLTLGLSPQKMPLQMIRRIYPKLVHNTELRSSQLRKWDLTFAKLLMSMEAPSYK